MFSSLMPYTYIIPASYDGLPAVSGMRGEQQNYCIIITIVSICR